MRNHYYCAYCANWRIVTSDHIHPRSKGGKLTVYVCTWCNFNKKDKSLGQWLSELPPEAPQHIYATQFLSMSDVDIENYRKMQKANLVRF